MAVGPLSPSMIMAGKGIVPDIGGTKPAETDYTLGINPKIGPLVDEYNRLNVVRQAPTGDWWIALQSEVDFLGGSINFLIDRDDLPPPKAPPKSGRIPFVPEVMPEGGISITDLFIKNARLEMCYDDPTSYILPEAEVGPRDLTKFAQFYGLCSTYRAQANEMINSTENTNIAAQTFTNMGALSTGSVSCMSTSFLLLGQDLMAQGNLIDFKYLDFLGYPSSIFRQMSKIGGLLPGVYDATKLVGLPDSTFSDIGTSKEPVAGETELKLYQALKLITGDSLLQLLELFSMTTKGIISGADLLDPKKIFPASYNTLMIQVPGTLPTSKTVDKMIYLPNGAIDTTIESVFINDETFLELRKIIPSDQALANTALVRAYSQIKNIKNTEFPDFAKSVTLLQNDKDLKAVKNMPEPLTPAVENFYSNNLADGSGPNKSTTLRDFMGVAAGYPLVDSLGVLVPAFKKLDISGGLDDLFALFDQMTGPYDPNSHDKQLVIDAAEEWIDIIDEIPGGKKALDLWNQLGDEISRNVTNYTLAGVVYDANVDPLAFQDLVENDRPSALALITNIHQLGVDTTDGGSAEIFTNICQPGTEESPRIYGQNFLNALREGLNNQALQDSGISTDNQMDSSPSVTTKTSMPPANG